MADIKPIFDQPPDTERLPTPYSDVSYSPQGFGAGVGDAVQQVAGVLEQQAKKAKADADATAVIGAIGAAKGVLNTTILDPQAGYFGTKGADAISKRDDFVRQFNDGIGKAESALTNDDQRRAFEQHAIDIREDGLKHIYSHEAAQQEDVSKAAFAGSADQTIRTMQAVVGSPTDLANQLADLHTLAIAEGQRRFGNNPQAIQSVVAPVMQKAAIDTMEAATSSTDPNRPPDPGAAAAAFEAVSPYLLNHERHYSAIVQQMKVQQAVKTQVAQLVSGAATTVVLPGGMQIPRLDDAKLDSALLAMPDSPQRGDVEKAIEQRRTILGKLWGQAVGQQVAAAETQGTNPITGAFSLDRVPAPLKLWLQQNAPDKLIALRGLDARQQRLASTEDRQISAGNYNNLVGQLIDPTLRKPVFGQMTPAEFQSFLLDDGKFPGGFTDGDTKRALQAFQKLKGEAGKLEEPVPRAVPEVLRAAFPNDPDGLQQKKYQGLLHDSMQRFVDDYRQTHKGVAPTSDEVRKFGESQLAKGKVEGTGTLYDDRVRLIEFQRRDQYAGRRFIPNDENAAPVTRPARVRAPSGKIKLVPFDQLDAAVQQGGVIVR